MRPALWLLAAAAPAALRVSSPAFIDGSHDLATEPAGHLDAEQPAGGDGKRDPGQPRQHLDQATPARRVPEQQPPPSTRRRRSWRLSGHRISCAEPGAGVQRTSGVSSRSRPSLEPMNDVRAHAEGLSREPVRLTDLALAFDETVASGP
jgi:hypothetical protein